jgi:signal transduction histidine kinase/DNA-binding response OmpR family regulator/ligand-binding sensor domain-containing protein
MYVDMKKHLLASRLFLCLVVLGTSLDIPSVIANAQVFKELSRHTTSNFKNVAPDYIHKDSFGGLWMQFDDKLMRKVGKTEVIFDLTKITAGDVEGQIVTIQSFDDGLLMGISNVMVLYNFEHNQFYKISSWSEINLKIQHITVDQFSTIWVITSSAIYYRTKQSEEFLSVDLADTKLAFGTDEFQNWNASVIGKSLWVSTFNVGTFSVDIVQKQVDSSFDNSDFPSDQYNRITGIDVFSSSKRDIVIVSKSGIFLNNTNKDSVSRLKITSQFRQIKDATSDAQGNIWFQDRLGLYRLSANLEVLAKEKYYIGSSLISEHISPNFFTFDDENSIWLSVDNQGLFRYSEHENYVKKYLVNSVEATVLDTGVFDSIIDDEEIFVGGNFGVVSSNGQNLARTPVFSLALSNAKQLYVGGIGGVERFDSKTNRMKEFYGVNANYEFDQIQFDQRDILWIHSRMTGVRAIDKDGNRVRLNMPRLNRVKALALIPPIKEREGMLAVFSNRIVHFNVTTKQHEVVYLTDENSIISAQNVDDNILLFRDDRRVTQISLDDYSTSSFKLPVNNVGCIVLLDNNDWLLAQEFGNIVRWNRQHDTVTSFDENAGIPAGGVNGRRCFSHKNQPLFTANDQLVTLDLSIESNNNQPILSLWSKGQLIQDKLVLKYDEFPLSLTVQNSSMASVKANQLKYRINGDENWSSIDNLSSEINFPVMPHGSYELEVLGSNNSGVWSEPNLLYLSVLPPLWLTWWAKIIYLVLTILVIYSFFVMRIRKATQYSNQLENEVEIRTEELAKEKSTVESLLADKEQEFIHVSHELRTPLTLVSGPIKAAKQLAKNPEIKSKLEMAERNGNRLLRMVDQLLQLERFRFQKVLEKIPKDAADVTEFIVESFQIPAARKEIKLSLVVNQPCVVSTVPDALEKILVNLISNAIKYSPSGSEIVVSSQVIISQWRLTVKDNGNGISDKHLKHVFDKFYRVTDNTSEQVTGAGIGLALVKELVRAHNGEVTVSSELGEGSEFNVVLPTCANDEKTTAVVSNSEFITSELENLELLPLKTKISDEHTDNLDLNKPSILIIEDNPDMQQYVKQVLDDRYQCFIANNGKEGVDRAVELIPDLIICDVMMPIMDGFEATKLIKQDERTSHIPVIMLTARGDKSSRLQGWRSLTDEYLSKPFDEQELMLRVENLMSIRRILKQRFAGIIKESGSLTVGNSGELGDVDAKLLGRLNQVIEEGFSNTEFNLNDMADKVFMSKRHLQRKLKALLDYSPVEYLRLFRLNKARELLLAGKPISEIWHEVGFSTQAYFSKCFRAQFGMSATEMLEKAR